MISLDPVNPLDNLEEPTGLLDYDHISTYIDNYKLVVINNVNRYPQAYDTSKPCLVCKKPRHTFDDCPILSNIPLLKKYYISWKTYLAKEN